MPARTASAMLQMSAFLIDPASSAQTATASGHAGVAQAVAGHLMMLPITQARGQLCSSPGDLLAATGLDRDGFLRGDDRALLSTAIRAFCRVRAGASGQGEACAWENCRLWSFPPICRSRSSSRFLARAEKLGADSLETTPQLPQWRRQWRLWRAARRGAF